MSEKLGLKAFLESAQQLTQAGRAQALLKPQIALSSFHTVSKDLDDYLGSDTYTDSSHLSALSTFAREFVETASGVLITARECCGSDSEAEQCDEFEAGLNSISERLGIER